MANNNPEGPKNSGNGGINPRLKSIKSLSRSNPLKASSVPARNNQTHCYETQGAAT